MRKWKLLKTYPGSPELGFELNDRDYNIGLTGTVIINGTFNYDIFNQTEYWEEIIEKPEYVKCITDISNTSYILNKIYKVDEDTDFVIGERSSVARWNNKFISGSKFEPSTKEAYDEQNKPKLDYEILSFTSQYPDVKEVCFKHDNGKFGRNWGQRSEHEMLIEVSKNIRKIHSIKRLSDDEIFTIGDKIYYTDGDFKHDHCPIDDLTIIDNKIYVNHHYKGKPNRFINEWIKVIPEPVKPVLFTTYDGVDITQGDINIYFCRNNSSFKVSMLIQSSKVNNLAEYYYFSTKEACQAYIDSFVPKIKEEPKTDLITVQLTKEKYDLLMQLLEE